WRQPVAARRQSAATANGLWLMAYGSRLMAEELRRNFTDSVRVEPIQEVHRFLPIELRILGLDEQEEPIPARTFEPRYVEHGVVGHRQAIQDDHPDHRCDRRKQDGQLECHRDELRPAVERLAGYVDRVG